MEKKLEITKFLKHIICLLFNMSNFKLWDENVTENRDRPFLSTRRNFQIKTPYLRYTN